jgi:hypothetical protein
MSLKSDSNGFTIYKVNSIIGCMQKMTKIFLLLTNFNFGQEKDLENELGSGFTDGLPKSIVQNCGLDGSSSDSIG